MKTAWLFAALLFLAACGQNPDSVYSSSSGQKYHAKSCRIVKGKTLREWLSKTAAEKQGLEPCRTCKP